MTREDAFLEAIIEEPDDDGLRLIYADWLEEHGGEARAEFIRVQIERARLPDTDARQWDLAERERELLAEHEANWTAALRPFVRRCGFRRGFVEEITVNAQPLVYHAQTIFRLAPVRHLAVRGVMSFASQPDAAARTEPLLEFAPDWRTIDLAYERIERKGLVLGLLARWDCFPALMGLNLEGNWLSRQSIEEFADSPLLGQLTSLGLAKNGFGPDGWAEVLRSKYCKRLQELRLGDNHLTAEQVSLFGGPPATERLLRLDLSFNPLGAAGAEALVETAPALSGLRELVLSRALGDIGDDGVRALARGPLLSQLHSLDLSLNRIGDAGARALLDYPYPTQFHKLDLIYNSISPSMMEELSRRFGKRVCLFRR
ncbi:MAG: TIGR02996 domain-containing protein [Planctomycetes bacterium]|nr:TIGR02996 domain-containing protein [Planctomycetota bacterium]